MYSIDILDKIFIGNYTNPTIYTIFVGMIYILDKAQKKLVEAEIVLMDNNHVPLKKDGWNFNWRQIFNNINGRTYVLKTLDSPKQVEGALRLIIEYDMLIMDVLEIAPHNIGQEHKRYDFVAGCLIAFTCRESFKLEGNYKGFLSFISKTQLIEWYAKMYGAELGIGQRMFISWENGERLIDKYLNRIKTV